IGVVLAAAGVKVQHMTGDLGERELVGRLVAQLVQAAAAAAVAERFPLRLVHVRQTLGLPKREGLGHAEAEITARAGGAPSRQRNALSPPLRGRVGKGVVAKVEPKPTATGSLPHPSTHRPHAVCVSAFTSSIASTKRLLISASASPLECLI